MLKTLWRVNFGTGSKFGMEVAKRYREGSELLAVVGKRGRKTVQTVKNYGSSKILRSRVLYYFSTEGSFVYRYRLRVGNELLLYPLAR